VISQKDFIFASMLFLDQYDSIVPMLKLAEKKANICVDKPFSKFVKLLNKHGVKIAIVEMKYENYQFFNNDMFINSLKFPNLIRHNQDCVTWSVSSNARRANILIAVGFNPRLKMFYPLAEPRSGDILTTRLRRYAAQGARGYSLPWVKTHGYPYNVPFGHESLRFGCSAGRFFHWTLKKKIEMLIADSVLIPQSFYIRLPAR
jgi:hypothetical protein